MTDILRAALVVVVALTAIACGSDGRPLPQPSPTALDLRGDYTVTLTADSACADLPVEARARTYAASMALTSVPTRYFVTLRGSSVFNLFF